MATIIYLSNDPSSVATYKKAYIGGRSPNASASVSTAVTTTTGSGDDIAMTLTGGGTTALWITEPLVEAVTLAAKPSFNAWCLEGTTADNAQIAIKLAKYTTSQQAVLLTSKYGTEAAAAIGRMSWTAATGDTVTSTAFVAGNRLVIAPYVDAVGTMGAGSFTMTYNGLTSNASGDTYIILSETLQAQNSQYGNGTTPFVPDGPGLQAYQGLIDSLSALQSGGLFGANAMLSDVLLELGYQRDMRV